MNIHTLSRTSHGEKKNRIGRTHINQIQTWLEAEEAALQVPQTGTMACRIPQVLAIHAKDFRLLNHRMNEHCQQSCPDPCLDSDTLVTPAIQLS